MIFLAWNQVKSETIKNYFIKAGLLDPKLDERDNNDENDIDESSSVTVVMELCTVDDLIGDKLMGANLSDEIECEEISPHSFKDTIDYIEKFRTLSVRIQVKKLFMN